MVRRARKDPEIKVKPVSQTSKGTQRVIRGQAKLTPGVLVRIKEMYSAGVNTTTILEIVGISYHAFKAFLEKNPKFNAEIEEIKLIKRIRKIKDLEGLRTKSVSTLKKATEIMDENILNKKEVIEEYTLDEQADIVTKAGNMSIKVLERVDPDFRRKQEVELKEELPEDIVERRREKIRNLEF